MKDFLIATAVIILLLLGVVLLSEAGITRIEEYLDALPSEEMTPEETAPALEALEERVKDDLFLLNTIFSHTRTDALELAVAGAIAAAKSRDEVELAIKRAELRSLLLDMHRDLTPHPADMI
ncbi:MAG: hypothetical protein J6V07_03190 [Clostridia bacterium]|nr:hypothetical protein [Clostridia bacterium]